MHNLNRLFIIKNATHYEVLKIYLNQNSISGNYVILTLDRLVGNEKLIQTIEKDKSLKLLEIFILKSKNEYLENFRVIKNVLKAKFLEKYVTLFDEVIISNYKTWFQHFLLNKLNPNKVTLLSDGLGLLEVPIIRNKRKTLPPERLPFRGNKFINSKILKLDPILNLNYFSQVNMNIGNDDSIEIFKYTRGNNREVDVDKVYFIGSPIVELEYIEQRNYIECLKKISNKLDSKNITYFAHRKEQQNNIESYSFLGNIVYNTIPFEIFLEKEDILPAIIVSHISSVLVNLAPVYPEIQFIYTPINSNCIIDSIFLKRYEIALDGFRNIQQKNFQSWEFFNSNSIN
ncbi:hypothetical protein [uncultured Christiangramia sp.]|uniref:hypothetical protein n=1 Tax=Christiangramia sp. 3-2217-3z TaxID=3417564 RepID=UPI0026145C46|nr:hypothetical protein [uncultured Christiangramia sp.]